MDTVKIDRKNALIIAHRGLSGIEKENTNSAFVAAGNRSYYGIETDIHRTADGHFIACHDYDLNRVAGIDAKPDELTLAELQNIILFDKDGTKNRSDLRLTTLENYISICKKYGKHCVLELKSAFTDEETARYIDIIRGFDYLDNVTFISFKYSNLQKVRALLPEQSVQYLFSEITDDKIALLSKDKMDADVNYTSLTEESIAAFHEAGITVNCWTVNKPEDAERLISWGVDQITTNILE